MCKKLIATILTVAVIISLTAVLPMASAVVYGENLIRNGGFEDVTSGVPDGWLGAGVWKNGSELSLVSEPENVHGGSYAVKYDTKNGDNPFWSQKITNLPPEYKYRISLWYKGEMTGSGMSVKFEQVGSGGNSEYYTPSVTESTSSWKYVEFDFYMNENTARVTVMPRTYSGGTVIYVDDISLEIIGAPEHFKTEFDSLFCYEEQTEVTVTSLLHSYYSGGSFSADIRVTDQNGEQVYFAAQPFENDSMIHKIDISSMQKKTQHLVQVSLKDENGSILKEEEYSFYRFDRPTAITAEGVYMVDGKPFEPVIMYHISREDYEKARECGVNVVQWNPFWHIDDYDYLTDELDYMHSIGMKAAVVLYWNGVTAGHDINIEEVKKLVAHIKDHPAVFCYMTMDEPFSHFDDAGEYLCRAYVAIRTMDDVHPVYHCEDGPDRYAEASRYVDTMGIDPYPVRNDFSKYVGDKTADAVAASRSNKPVYAILQAFTWYVTPTPAMLRSQMYQAIMAGARGIGFYTWEPDDPTIDTKLGDGIYRDTLISFDKLDKSILYAYYCRGEMDTVATYRDEDVWCDVFTDGNVYYVAVQLRGTEAKKVTIPAEGIAGECRISVISGGENEDITKAGNSLDIELDAYGALLFKLIPPSAEQGIFISRSGESITAEAEGLKSGERLILTAHETKNGAQYITAVEVCSAGKDGYAVCRLDKADQNAIIKAFVINEKLVVTRRN